MFFAPSKGLPYDRLAIYTLSVRAPLWRCFGDLFELFLAFFLLCPDVQQIRSVHMSICPYEEQIIYHYLWAELE
jgi:hypothetical protein